MTTTGASVATSHATFRGSGSDPVDPGQQPYKPSLARLGIWVAVLAAPVLAFFVLRVRPMFTTDAVDPNIYTGYSHNGADLMERFGASYYHWVRLGAILPERLAYLAFGSLPGFYVLRWLLLLLIVAPLFGLLDRVSSRPAAWLGVVVFLTNSVMWMSLGSDYPDAFIFAYLVGAYALLFIPLRRRLWRVTAWVAVGVLTAACLHSQVVCAPIVVALLVSFVVATLRRGRVRGTLAAVLAVAVGGVAITGVFVAVAYLWLGHADIFSPTILNYQSLQQPNEVAQWHSESWLWTAYVPYVAVPAVVGVGWVAAVAATRARHTSRAELAAGCWLLLSAAAYYLMQYVGSVATLEYRLYSSSLWAPTLVVLTFLLGRIVEVGREGFSRQVWAVSGVLLLLALLAGVLSLPVTPHRLRVTGIVSLALVAVCLGAAVRRVGVRVAAACVLCLGLTALTLAPAYKFQQGDISPLPLGAYDQILGRSNVRIDVEAYSAATRMPDLIGPSTAPRQVPSFWDSATAPYQITNAMSAMYLWRRMPTGIPAPDNVAGFVSGIRTFRPSPLVICATSTSEVQEMLQVLTDNGVAARTRTETRIEGGGVTLSVLVVDVS